MTATWSRLLGATAAILMLSSVAGDCYLHFPPGMNDRNRERNENRDNDQRMCDTQNNDKGGYPWCGDRTLTGVPGGYYFYAGSIMTLEWTNQHSCGPAASANAYCNVIIQALCNDLGSELTGDLIRSPRNIRDGYPTEPSTDATNGNNNADDNNAGYYQAWFWSEGQNQDGTNTIPCPTQPDSPYNTVNCDAPNFVTNGNTADPLNVGTTTSQAFYDSNMTAAPEGTDCSGNGGRGSTEQTCYIPVEFGYHESFEYYLQFGLKTSRNLGIYTADQQLNGNSAIYTRQNPNGNRHGFEIPEERDYYPWWNPSPWRDLAVLVADTAWCNYFTSTSENTTPRQYCVISDASRAAIPNQRTPISSTMCTKYGGVWTTYNAWKSDANYSTITAPDCKLHMLGRDNHLGNAIPTDSAGNTQGRYPEAQRYNLTVPAWMANKACVLRIRYNISTADYPMITSFTQQGDFYNASKNCPATTSTSQGTVDGLTITGTNTQCYNVLTDGSVPLYNRPSVTVDPNVNIKLAIAFNTNQVGRTFQDRTYVLKFYTAPANAANSVIWNLNMRGRRGNIVQCYPAVENDFIPNKMRVTTTDFVHIQFCGSDYNPQNNPNDGEGWEYSTRTNLIQMRDHTFEGVDYNGPQNNFPRSSDTQTMFTDATVRQRMAFVDQNPTLCGNYEGQNNDNENNAYNNCNKLNMAAAHFDGGLVQFTANSAGYNYLSTRNNNFSNRSQKGVLYVDAASTALTTAQAAAVGVGVLAAFGVVGFFGARAYSKRNPNSKTAAVYEKVTNGSMQTWSRISGYETTSTGV